MNNQNEFENGIPREGFRKPEALGHILTPPGQQEVEPFPAASTRLPSETASSEGTQAKGTSPDNQAVAATPET